MSTTAAGATPAPPARPVRPASKGYTFPAAPVRKDYLALKEAIAKDEFDSGLEHQPPEVSEDQVPDFVKERLPAEIADMSNNFRTKILGVDYAVVSTALLVSLALGRKTGNYTALFLDLTLAVATAYTVSRDTSDFYRKLGDASAFKDFEIQGRTRPNDPALASKNAWIASSNMNASALRLAGHLIVESAPRGGFLFQVKETKGTPFSPVKGGKELEELMRKASEELTDADKSALQSFKAEFGKVLRVMDRIWGAAGASAEAAERAAHSVQGALL